ncbi:MAG: hypothetical protein ACRDQU_01385 [Pseudonocardiaceae bacterium]
MIDEAARLVRPQGRIVVTTWEGCDAAPGRFPRDLPRLIEDADLVVDAYTEQPSWLERQLGIYYRAAAVEVDGPGDPAVSDLTEEGRRWQHLRGRVRRVFLTAHRPGTNPACATSNPARS